ncbi:tRNA pseudouridine(55) synthase TruB [Subtercola sp. PAMC28395]|uniref:tRNA pseudouridine(55) synthase TruB n=1 Tax=Subtercola sp. PAMC28395 TaxID=2846775 RepID=UPI001C0B1306|nr:tRNA pseudouridine(55) synthase TruB [Subtercola sp. PAMC28395]
MTSSGLTSGIVLIDKPQGLTSHDVVARTRKLAGTRKVGHAGTLDPLATGLLVLGLNSSTRLLTYIVGLDKEYEATIRLGEATTTDDSEGETIESADPEAVQNLTAADIERALVPLTGDVLQIPSSVSAIRVDGKRAYTRVREGETVVLDARPVTIASIDVLDISRASSTALSSTLTSNTALSNTPLSNTALSNTPTSTTSTSTTAASPPPAFVDVAVRVTCSSGTYVRAIARDLGEALGVGGHLTSLRRTRIGPFQVNTAHTLPELDPARDLVPPATIAAKLFPVVTLDAERSIDLRNGKRIAVDAPKGCTVAAIDPAGELIGLFESKGGTARVLVNFPSDARTAAEAAVKHDAVTDAAADETTADETTADETTAVVTPEQDPS